MENKILCVREKLSIYLRKDGCKMILPITQIRCVSRENWELSSHEVLDNIHTKQL